MPLRARSAPVVTTAASDCGSRHAGWSRIKGLSAVLGSLELSSKQLLKLVNVDFSV